MSLYEEENALLKGLASHDPHAIENIYRESYQTIQAFIIKNSGYADDARDIFQEAMIVLFEKSKSDSFELTCRIKTYLFSVCRRLWLKKLQKDNRYSPEIEMMHETIPVEDEIELHDKRNEDMQNMEQALIKLGEPCKSLLEAFYIQDRTMPEIAELFSYTNADNAKNQKYKCLVRLKKIFFSQYKNSNEHE